jgi:hypothetical protein
MFGAKEAEVAGIWTILHDEAHHNFTSPSVSADY